MKKTLIALFAMSSVAMAGSITLHNTTFDIESSTASKINQTNSNVYISAPTTGDSAYTPATSFGGFYFAAGTGLKFNNSSTIQMNYLYIGEGIVFGGRSSNVAGEINWTSGGSITIKDSVGAWVDVNFSTGSRINTENMQNGTVYLNDKGFLTSTLSEGNVVHATLLTEGYEGVAGYDYDEATQVLTRTLMTGNFSNWTSAETGIVLDNLNKLDSSRVGYLANANGLFVTYNMANVPEPTTGALSLLALAGLCIRRRK